jgi:hypothetical protein
MAMVLVQPARKPDHLLSGCETGKTGWGKALMMTHNIRGVIVVGCSGLWGVLPFNDAHNSGCERPHHSVGRHLTCCHLASIPQFFLFFLHSRILSSSGEVLHQGRAHRVNLGDPQNLDFSLIWEILATYIAYLANFYHNWEEQFFKVCPSSNSFMRPPMFCIGRFVSHHALVDVPYTHVLKVYCCVN